MFQIPDFLCVYDQLVTLHLHKIKFEKSHGDIAQTSRVMLDIPIEVPLFIVS